MDEGKQVQLDERYIETATEDAAADAHRLTEFLDNLTGDRREEFAQQCFGVGPMILPPSLGSNTARDGTGEP